MRTSILRTVKEKYQLSATEIAHRLNIKDPTVSRVLNGNRGIGASLLKRIYKVWPDEVIKWLEDNDD